MRWGVVFSRVARRTVSHASYISRAAREADFDPLILGLRRGGGGEARNGRQSARNNSQTNATRTTKTLHKKEHAHTQGGVLRLFFLIACARPVPLQQIYPAASVVEEDALTCHA